VPLLENISKIGRERVQEMVQGIPEYCSPYMLGSNVSKRMGQSSKKTAIPFDL